MGQAFDRTGALLGAAEADSAREVLEKLQQAYPAAEEFKIKTLEGRLTEEETKARAVVEQDRAATLPTDRMLQFFVFEHLPEHLRAVSVPFALLAERIVTTLPSNPERTVALRKLLEAKDCAVRALLFK